MLTSGAGRRAGGERRARLVDVRHGLRRRRVRPSARRVGLRRGPPGDPATGSSARRDPRGAAGDRPDQRRARGLEHGLGVPVRAGRPDPTDSRRWRLRRLQDDVVRPALASIAGVVEVASLGGARRGGGGGDPRRRAPRARPGVSATWSRAVRCARRRPDRSTASPRSTRSPCGHRPTRLRPREFGSRTWPVAASPATPCRTGSADLAGLSSAVGGIVIAKRGADLDLGHRGRPADARRVAGTAARRGAAGDGLRSPGPRQPRRAHAAAGARPRRLPWSRW